MPRPSDLYATLGAPGMYQATPTNWISYQLPCVYVFPPEEDNQKVLCLFQAGSASPAPYQSFYDVPDEDPFSSDHIEFERGLRRRNPKVTYRSHNWRAPEQVTTTSLGSGSSISSASTRWSSDSMADQPDQAAIFLNQPCDMNLSDHLDDHWQETHVPIRPASRRSSVFGDRPSNHEVPEVGGQDEISQSGICRSPSLSMSIKNKAATALKAMGGSRSRRREGESRRTENASESAMDPRPDPTYGSWFESDLLPPQRKKNARRTLAELFVSRSSTSDTSAVSPREDVKSLRPLPTATNKNVIGRRKSVTRLLRLNHDKQAATRGDELPPSTDVTSVISPLSTSLTLPERGRKMTKFKSMSQMLGLGGSLSKLPSTNSMANITDQEEMLQSQLNISPQTVLPDKTFAPAGPEPAFPLQQSLGRSGSPVSLESKASTARPPKRRASFLNGCNFSFRQLQRHFTPSQTPDIPSDNTANVERASSSDSTEVLSEGQCSPHPSTDSETGEDEPQSPIVVDIPTIIVGDDCVQDPVISDDTQKPKPVDIEEEFDFTARFGLRVDDSGRPTDSPIMELAVQLNSLDFDRLAFDPDAFTNSIYDD
ncbi:hypothetical protein BU17DRAFT_98293 [Hysterangium stoloniferum]|nr:hypothetical protein BU17DRAFT_98293 [Hysterangium stoloniferum]